jgi:hypothetical protein
MMERQELPPELERLELDLAGRPRPGLPADLRERVLQSAKARLVEPGLPKKRPNGWWAFAAATAATAVFWLNLSWSAACSSSYDLKLDADGDSIETAAGQIRELLPEMSHDDAVWQAVTLQAGWKLIRSPDFSSDASIRDRLKTFDEQES